MKQLAWECWLALCVLLVLSVLVFSNRLQRHEPTLPDEPSTSAAIDPLPPLHPVDPVPSPFVIKQSGCNCCDACQCVECQCAKSGKRCSPDCTCGETTAEYYCRICGRHRYKFPNGRPTEPRLFCPHCKRVEFRSDTKQGAEIKRWFEAAARTRIQSGNC